MGTIYSVLIGIIILCAILYWSAKGIIKIIKYPFEYFSKEARYERAVQIKDDGKYHHDNYWRGLASEEINIDGMILMPNNVMSFTLRKDGYKLLNHATGCSRIFSKNKIDRLVNKGLIKKIK